jgi:hypothetical protein
VGPADTTMIPPPPDTEPEILDEEPTEVGFSIYPEVFANGPLFDITDLLEDDEVGE